ncbi:hypothetical protein NKR23_g12366 [Pleurostoma richardsiae]|uniref:Myb-like domain-containing protein n=1 Tax=Pleurostoma richardsiae TaxID=41990 RepID=A0AA38VG36_9PEZI|nr:hypothetical protein NKR23_g12366 [Pleurostoma richardsiae]
MIMLLLSVSICGSRSHPMEEVDAASDHEHYRATKRRSLEKAGLTKSESRRRRETASTILPPSSSAADIEDRLHAILGEQDDEFTPHQFAVAMIKICLSIIENEPPSNVPRAEPGLSSPDASPSQVEDVKLSEPDEDDDVIASDGTKSDDDSCGGTRSKKVSRRNGQRRRWSSLEEKRLEEYMKEAKEEAWIASKLGRSVSAVRQHWDIMCKRQSRRLSCVWLCERDEAKTTEDQEA